REVVVELGSVAPLTEPSIRLARGDPQQPPAQRAVATVAAERSVGHREALLCHVLGVVRTAEDPKAGAVDDTLLSLHDEPEHLSIARQHGVDEGAVLHAL